MIFKNRKKNYPLYETTHMRDFREAVENVAKKHPDDKALTFRRKPSDKFLEVMQIIGMILLFALMILAFGNDIFKLFR